jgi:hypothetical protein
MYFLDILTVNTTILLWITKGCTRLVIWYERHSTYTTMYFLDILPNCQNYISHVGYTNVCSPLAFWWGRHPTYSTMIRSAALLKKNYKKFLILSAIFYFKEDLSGTFVLLIDIPRIFANIPHKSTNENLQLCKLAQFYGHMLKAGIVC